MTSGEPRTLLAAVASALAGDERIAYAIVFGSTARGCAHAGSALDIALASHWLAAEGWGVPATYGEIFSALAEHGTLGADLANRMSAATGLRNLIAHRYAAVDWARVHAIASEDLGDLLEYCNALVARAGEG